MGGRWCSPCLSCSHGDGLVARRGVGTGTEPSPLNEGLVRAPAVMSLAVLFVY